MLKTNSKKALENLKKYIVDNFDGSNYGIETPDTFEEVAKIIIDTFRSEKYSDLESRRYYKNNEFLAFCDWCAGLPSILDTCYYYNRAAVDDLAVILEETEEEKARYTEEQAESTLTRIIYNALTR